MSTELLDAAGRLRSAATLPGYRLGCPPRNKGRRYPADPPRVEEIIGVMRAAGTTVHGERLRALIVILWRAGLRIQEALALAETELEPRRGSILVRRGKGGKRREVGMDDWAWEQVEPWRQIRTTMPIGPFLCVIHGPTCGRGWSQTGARAELRRLGATAGVRRRFAPHQLRHAQAVEMAREGVPLPVIQRQLGHAHLGVTAPTCRASTPLRSSTPSTTGAHPRSRPAPPSRSDPASGTTRKGSAFRWSIRAAVLRVGRAGGRRCQPAMARRNPCWSQ
jgi:integrase